MRRNTIGLIWVAGILLTLGLYAIGPERFLQVGFGVLQVGFGVVQDVRALFRGIVLALTSQAFELVRALAIGLFAVFVALAVMASRRGLRARAALVVLPVVFVALLYPAMDGGTVSSGRWFGAFVLAAVGALVMTRRLVSPFLNDRRA